MTIEEIKNQIAENEKLVNITKKLRDDALKAKTESETKLAIATEEMHKLGVDPQNAEAEIERLNSEIEVQLKEMKDSIPVELLRELKRI